MAHNLNLRRRRESDPTVRSGQIFNGARVSDDSRTMAATILGAVIGGIAGYLSSRTTERIAAAV